MPNEDKATRYRRLDRRASVARAAAGASFLLLFVLTGASAWLRDVVGAGGPAFFVTVVVHAAAVALAYELVRLPLAFYRGVTLERRYGLSTQASTDWWTGRARAAPLAVLLTVAGAMTVAWLLRWSPEHWWVGAAVAFTAGLMLLARLLPAALAPLVYELKPLERASLSGRLTALASCARTPVLGIFEWRLGDRTRRANAAVIGVGRTRRILLSDTLLAEHRDDEIEVIVAHELGHHVHRDIGKAVAAEAAVLALGFFAADRLLGLAGGSFGLAGKTDIAALPLIALALGVVSVACRPLTNACSRAHERRADRYALDTTRNVAAFVSVVRRLAVQNLVEERPSRTVELLFATHPPPAARIAAAESWKRQATYAGS